MGPVQTKKYSLYVSFNGMWEGPVFRVGKTDEEQLVVDGFRKETTV